MNTKPVEAKVRTSGPHSTTLLIRARGVAIETEYAELSPCEFPIWASAPVPVEIPAGGTKSFIVGPFSGSVSQKAATGDFPNIIKFPVYRQQETVALRDYDDLRDPDAAQVLAKVPLAALATAVSGVVDGRLVQTHSVLPFWNDGSSVLVTLDWFDGEPSEGMPNPEWHMRASTGLPARLGLERLQEASQLPPGAAHCRYQIHLSPWMLGACLLQDKGQEAAHPIWQREWTFDRHTDFENALGQIRRGLVGVDRTGERNAA
jgi:hypothetical protein